MARNVTYSVSPRINPKDKNMPFKYYGHVQANGDVSLREMSERINRLVLFTKVMYLRYLLPWKMLFQKP